LVFDLGEGASLVGITKFCVHPPEEVAAVEKVGGTKDPNLVRITDIAPDLILMNREENRREDWEHLQDMGLRCHVSHPDTVISTAGFVRELGELLGRKEQARIIAEDIEDALAKARQNSARRKPVSWAYLIWRKPWMTVNGTTYIHHLLTEAGGANVFADVDKPYPAISAEDLAREDPDLVMLSSEPFPFKEKHIAELARATGLGPERFRIVDGELLSWHGAFTARGLRYADELFAAFV
jgi:ABC-type Fe3+-hydroxamate transport system substrate-binding protein